MESYICKKSQTLTYIIQVNDETLQVLFGEIEG